MTALLFAVRDGNMPMTQLLLDSGADIQLASANDTSPLIIALLNGQTGIASYLLDRGANPNARSRIGSEGTALHSAAFEGNLEMVKLLVAASADIHAIDREHQGTPEGWARAAIEITNNPQCAVVADYLRETLTSAPARPVRRAPPPKPV